jgi:hypothetical protein
MIGESMRISNEAAAFGLCAAAAMAHGRERVALPDRAFKRTFSRSSLGKPFRGIATVKSLTIASSCAVT